MLYSVGAPERGQSLTVRTLTELFKGSISNLADSFAGDTQQGPDFLQGALLPVVQSVVEVQDFALAFGQVFLEHPIEKLALSLGLDRFFDIFRFRASKPLPKRCAVSVTPVDRCVEREFGGR